MSPEVTFGYRRASIKAQLEPAGRPPELGPPQRWLSQWIDRYMAPGHVFYDVGAGAGVFALLAAQLHAAPIQVFAFAAPAAFDTLCRNLKANAGGDTVHPIALTTARLDDVGATLSLPMPNHIRVAGDAEPVDVLSGATHVLGDPRLLTMAIELADGSTAEQIQAMLAGRGFRLLRRVTSESRRAGGAGTLLLFVRIA